MSAGFSVEYFWRSESNDYGESLSDQAAIDAHHASPMMAQLAALREKYDLHMTAERFVSENIGTDEQFIRK